jgi:hypothetical protein
MKSAKRQFLTKVDGIEGYWAQRTGGEISADTNKVFDGGSLRPDVLSGPAQVDDIVVTRPYDPARDQVLLNQLKSRVGTWRTTVSQTPTETDLTVSKVPGDVYPDALLIKVKPPESDSGSSDAAELELTFAVPTVG